MISLDFYIYFAFLVINLTNTICPQTWYICIPLLYHISLDVTSKSIFILCFLILIDICKSWPLLCNQETRFVLVKIRQLITTISLSFFVAERQVLKSQYIVGIPLSFDCYISEVHNASCLSINQLKNWYFLTTVSWVYCLLLGTMSVIQCNSSNNNITLMLSSVLLSLDPFLSSSACQNWNGTCDRIEENAQFLWALYVTQHSVIYSPPHNWVAYRRGSHKVMHLLMS